MCLHSHLGLNPGASYPEFLPSAVRSVHGADMLLTHSHLHDLTHVIEPTYSVFLKAIPTGSIWTTPHPFLYDIVVKYYISD